MDEPKKTKVSRRTLLLGVIVAALGVAVVAGPFAVGGLLLHYQQNAKFTLKTEALTRESDLARFAVGPLERLETPAELKPAPGYVFRDRNGTAVRFSAFKGKVVVVNLWAMWCAPCRTEMPTLARLAQRYQADEDLIVLPINVDATQDALADAKSFIDVHEPLPLYSDIKFQLPFEFPGKGAMPRTIFLDREGRIRAVFAGEADWDSPQARALIDALLAEGKPETPSA